MKRRKWTAKQKTQVVLEGLRGVPLGELCAKHEISQTIFYRWKDQFLSNAERAFEANEATKREERLKREIHKLKSVIGDLTVELKKNEYDE